MRRSRETINATVLTAAIWVDARFEADVGTFVACDNAFCRVAKKLRRAARRLLARIDIDNIRIVKIDMKFFEAISRIACRATTAR